MVKDLKPGYVTMKLKIFFNKFEGPEKYVEAFIPGMDLNIKGKSKQEIIDKINKVENQSYSESW